MASEYRTFVCAAKIIGVISPLSVATATLTSTELYLSNRQLSIKPLRNTCQSNSYVTPVNQAAK